MRRRESFREPVARESRGRRVRPRGRAEPDAASTVPAVLPLVVVEAHGEVLLVTVNGDKEHAETVQRTELGVVLARVVAGFGVSTRVEVHESDGSVHADIVQPPQPQREDRAAAQDSTASSGPHLVELQADGFLAGEDVAVAVVLRHNSAGPAGRARALIDLAEVSGPESAEVVLVGRISGETAFRSLT